MYVWYDWITCVSSRVCMCDMTHSYVWHRYCGNKRRVCRCAMTHSCVWHEAFVCVTWLIHMCDMRLVGIRDIHVCVCVTYMCVCVTWFVHTCVSYVWHDSCIYVTWLTHMCDMTHPRVWHGGDRRYLCVCDMTQSYVWHDSFMCVTWLTPWAGPNTEPLFRSSNAEPDFKNGHIFRFHFVSNPSNLVGKDLLCRRSWLQLHFKNEGTPPDFQPSFWQKKTVKTFSTHVLIRGCSFLIENPFRRDSLY